MEGWMDGWMDGWMKQETQLQPTYETLN